MKREDVFEIEGVVYRCEWYRCGFDDYRFVKAFVGKQDVFDALKERIQDRIFELIHEQEGAAA